MCSFGRNTNNGVVAALDGGSNKRKDALTRSLHEELQAKHPKAYR